MYKMAAEYERMETALAALEDRRNIISSSNSIVGCSPSKNVTVQTELWNITSLTEHPNRALKDDPTMTIPW